MEQRERKKGPGILYTGKIKNSDKPKLKLILNSEVLREAIANGDTVELVGFVNDYKKKETDPDFNLRFARKSGGTQGASDSGNSKQSFPF